MRGALLRNLSLYTRSRHFSLCLKPTHPFSNACNNFHRKIDTADNAQIPSYFSSRMRFFSSENGTQDSDPNPESESGVAPTEEKAPLAAAEAEVAEVEDVDNKELKAQIEYYLQNLNEETLLEIFESVLTRKLSAEHEDSDDEILDELQLRPLDKHT